MPLREIQAALVQSYLQDGGINHVGGTSLPSQAAVDALASDFMHLLFPGYFEQRCLTRAELPLWLEAHLGQLFQNLREELGKCLALPGSAPTVVGKDPASVAEQWIGALPALRRLVQTDVEAAYEGDPAALSYDEIILSYPCIPAIALQRVAHVAYRLGVPLLPRMLTECAHRLTGIDIHPGASIGSHFFIDHGTGVVIGETATIGSRVKLYQGVTLGAKSFPKDAAGNIIKGSKRHPDIEDQVTIYAGATVLGGDTRVGAHSTIGSNVWLMQSVPAHSFVNAEGNRLVIRDRRQRSSDPSFAASEGDGI